MGLPLLAAPSRMGCRSVGTTYGIATMENGLMFSPFGDDSDRVWHFIATLKTPLYFQHIHILLNCVPKPFYFKTQRGVVGGCSENRRMSTVTHRFVIIERPQVRATTLLQVHARKMQSVQYIWLLQKVCSLLLH